MVDEKTIKTHLTKFKPICAVCNKRIYADECARVIYVKTSNHRVKVIHHKCFKKEGEK